MKKIVLFLLCLAGLAFAVDFDFKTSPDLVKGIGGMGEKSALTYDGVTSTILCNNMTEVSIREGGGLTTIDAKKTDYINYDRERGNASPLFAKLEVGWQRSANSIEI